MGQAPIFSLTAAIGHVRLLWPGNTAGDAATGLAGVCCCCTAVANA